MAATAGSEIDAVQYISRVVEMLEQWSLLSGVATAEIKRWEPLFRGIFDERRVNFTRAKCPLFADGAPIEFCETVAAWAGGVALNVDPAAYREGDSQSIARAAIASLIKTVPGAAPLAAFTGLGNPIWLGGEMRRGGGVGLWVYRAIPGEDRLTDAEDSRLGLEQLRVGPSRAALRILGVLRERAVPRMVGMSLYPVEESRFALYFRLYRSDWRLVQEIVGAAGLSEELFDRFARLFLGAARPWTGRRAGMGLELDGRGEPAGVTFYQNASHHFKSDADLRARVLTVAGEFGWNVGTYRSTSQLLRASDGRRLRRLIGIGATHANGSALRLYGSTEYLSQRCLDSE